MDERCGPVTYVGGSHRWGLIPGGDFFEQGEVDVAFEITECPNVPELVGAYAVSGATGDQDEVISEYAREKVGWSKVSSDPVPDDVKKHVNEIYSRVGLSHRKL